MQPSLLLSITYAPWELASSAKNGSSPTRPTKAFDVMVFLHMR